MYSVGHACGLSGQYYQGVGVGQWQYDSGPWSVAWWRVWWSNDNDNDTLREVPHPSNEGLALQARVSGP